MCRAFGVHFFLAHPVGLYMRQSRLHEKLRTRQNDQNGQNPNKILSKFTNKCTKNCQDSFTDSFTSWAPITELSIYSSLLQWIDYSDVAYVLIALRTQNKSVDHYVTLTRLTYLVSLRPDFPWWVKFTASCVYRFRLTSSKSQLDVHQKHLRSN